MKLPGSIGIGVLGTKNVRISGFKVPERRLRRHPGRAELEGLGAHNLLKHHGDVGVDLNGSSWSQAILVGSASSVHILINGNRVARNHFGIFLEGVGRPVHATLHGNRFHRVHKPVKQVIVH